MDKWENRLAVSLCSSTLSETISFPLDVCKTKMQLSIKSTNFSNTLFGIIKNNGIKSLWTGLTPALIRQNCYSSMKMVIYMPILNKINNEENPSFISRFIAGGIAGGTSMCVFNWTDVLKINMQKNPSINITTVLMNIIKNSGYRGLILSGMGPNVGRTFIVNAAELGTYDNTNSYLKTKLTNKMNINILSGCFAGFISSCVSSPIDILKTRSMAIASTRNKTNLFLITKNILFNEGPLAFYKGFYPVCLRNCLWCTVFFFSYSSLSDYFFIN